MRWWMKVRRLWILALSLAVLALALRLLEGRALVVPTVVGGGAAAILWATFLPLIWAAALCGAYEELGGQVEGRPGLRLALYDAALFLLSNAALFALLRSASTPEVWPKVLSHALIVSGLATLVTALIGASAGILAATALMLVTSTYSLHLSGAAYVRLLQPEGDTAFSLLVGLTLSASAVGALLGGARPSDHR